jgi:hypothetical protein
MYKEHTTYFKSFLKQKSTVSFPNHEGGKTKRSSFYPQLNLTIPMIPSINQAFILQGQYISMNMRPFMLHGYSSWSGSLSKKKYHAPFLQKHSKMYTSIAIPTWS